MTRGVRVPAVGLVVLFLASAVLAEEPGRSRVRLPRVSTPITIDGDLSDPGWREAARFDTFYEINRGDNVTPPVRTVAYAAYDAEFLYIGFDCQDPDPAAIRAPFVDRDNVNSDQDFAGVFLDTRHDRRSAIELFANPRGSQDDGMRNEANGNEDMSPDFFWESAGKIGPHGWSLEMRIPLTSLRYKNIDPQTWGIMFYRNYPRDYRYQIFSVKVPRGGNCLLCQEHDLEGITGLPSAAHLVVAPYASLKETGTQEDDGRFRNHPLVGQAGVDVKWTPNADTAIDLTLNPDFSQVESDAAQLSVNQRFALFYPEKRPFFLEGIDLFDTPIKAVYTRTITSPNWGARATGKLDSTGYTVLVAHDRGGGSAILPGPQSSSFVDQDFASTAAIARLRRDVGNSYVGFLATDRENGDGSYNRVAGPDFQWRPNDREQVTVQYLWSESLTPNRTDLDETWDGRRIGGGGLYADWQHSTRTFGSQTTYYDFGDGFRADSGFVPQVGYRKAFEQLYYNFYADHGLLTRIMPYLVGTHSWNRDGRTIFGSVFPGIYMQGTHGLNAEVDFDVDAIRVGNTLLHRKQFLWTASLSPSRVISKVSLSGSTGEEIDVDNVREGRGTSISLGVTARAGDHMTLQYDGTRAWLDVDDPGATGRLFTADLARLKAVYSFSPRAFIRAIAQYERIRRDPSLYVDAVDAYDGGLAGSFLFAYKLNWQSVLFAGYGDNRALSDRGILGRKDREFFIKVSYAFQ